MIKSIPLGWLCPSTRNVRRSGRRGDQSPAQGRPSGDEAADCPCALLPGVGAVARSEDASEELEEAA